MRSFIDQHAIPDGADFIDAVGKLEAAVLDMHRGRDVPHEAAIHIGKAGHWTGISPSRRQAARPY